VIFPLFDAQKRVDHYRSIIIETMEVTMAQHEQPEAGWRKFVMEANDIGAATVFTPATDFGPVVFRGDRSPDDAAALLPDANATKLIAIGQTASDLHGAIPTHEEISELRLEVTGLKNRLADLKRPLSEGGSPVPATAWQIADVERKLERAEKELARRVELKETRTVRWTAAGRLHQSVSDWVLRGIPANCVIETVVDQPVNELLTKADGGRLDAAAQRYRLRRRELAADLHRVRSSPWPSSLAKAAAKELIDRLADAGMPNLDAAIEHGMDIGFATTRLQSLVYNAQPGAVAYAEVPDVLGLLAWVIRDQLLAKINAGFDEIADDKSALSQQQREEMEAQISADSLAAERAECSLIWAAAERGEVIDFRPDTSPQAALGVRLVVVPRATELPATTPGHSWPWRR
jgi:hypothetical protein